MKLVITGVAGFLGQALVAAALEAGHAVIGVGRSPSPPVGLPVAAWCAADMRTSAETHFDWEAYRGATVLHLAADTRIHDQRHDIESATLAVTDAACRIARRTGGGIVCLSSAAVYSGAGTRYPLRRLDENSPVRPNTAYGRAKLAMERRVADSSLPFMILRPFSIIGRSLLHAPGRGHLVQQIALAVNTQTPISLATDDAGRLFVRDYASVGDVAWKILRAAERLAASGDSGAILNLCTGTPLNTREMVEAAGQAIACRIPVRYETRPRQDCVILVGSPKRMLEQLGPLKSVNPLEFWQDIFKAGLLHGLSNTDAVGPITENCC